MTYIIKKNVYVWDIWDLQRWGWKVKGIKRDKDYIKVYVDLDFNKKK